MTTKKHPTNLELAYMAGIIDGEGCLDIHIDNRSNSAIPRIRVEMSQLETIVWLQDKWQGHKIYTSKRINTNHLTTYRWTVQGKDCLEIVKLLIPFLQGKKKEAEILLNFPFSGKGKVVPIEIINKRLDLKKQLTNCKTKGKGKINYG